MKKEIKDSTANIITMGGITAMLLIAGLPLSLSAGIITISGISCAYITHKNKK